MATSADLTLPSEGSMDKHVKCAICFEHFQDPRTLPCHHAFCLDCIRNWTGTGKNSNQTRLVCPTCRQEVVLDVKGVEGLPVVVPEEATDTPTGDGNTGDKKYAGGEKQVGDQEITADEKLSGDKACRPAGDEKHGGDKAGRPAGDEKHGGDDEKKVLCDNCPGKSCDQPSTKKTTATFYCYDCQQHFCDECHKLHQALKVNDVHKIVHHNGASENLPARSDGSERFCTTHDKIVVEFFCETEQKTVCSHCIHLKTCLAQHQRIGLQEAAKKYRTEIDKLSRELGSSKEKYQETLLKTEQALQEVKSSEKDVLGELRRVKSEHAQKLEQTFKQDEANVVNDCKEKVKVITAAIQSLESSVDAIGNVEQQSMKVRHSESAYEIMSTYSLLVNTLKDVAKTIPESADYTRHLHYKPAHFHACSDHLLIRTEWKASGSIRTTPHLRDICGIAVNRNGDIAVSGIRNGLRLFQPNGQVKCTFLDSPETAYNVAVTPDDRFVIDGKHGFICYDQFGQKLSTTQTTDVKNKPSHPYGIAVDNKGRIVVELTDCISVHYADGSLQSKASLHETPWRLAVTSDEQLVVSCYDGTLVLMDYNGVVVRVINPPPDVSRWNPGYVCCSHKYGEIFVGNMGKPKAVYCFKSDGEYIGLVTDQLDKPQGIAVTEDGKRLFVAEINENVIKIFQRK